jgi:hypothetical protein
MNTEHLECIRERATAFRAAIEACDKNRLCISFQEYPLGSCGDASSLLGKYLTDSGLGSFRYVAGEYMSGEDYQSHAWVEQDGLIIDITADQFTDVNTPVWLTTERHWHNQFDIDVNEDARDYAEVLKHL